MRDLPRPMPIKPPSRWWYLLSVAAFLCGFVAMAAFMWPRLMSMGDELVQVVVPGEAELVLEKSGTYTIFHESKSVVDGQAFVSETVAGLRVVVRSVSGGDPVKLTSSTTSSSYNIGGRSGSSLFTFVVQTPGRYRMAATYDDGRSGPKAVLAVGHGFLGALFKTIFGALVFAFSGVIAAGVIAYLIWRRRRSALSGAPG